MSAMLLTYFDKITNSSVGCVVFHKSFNLLAYADDLVLLAPSWVGLQILIEMLAAEADVIWTECEYKENCHNDI